MADAKTNADRCVMQNLKKHHFISKTIKHLGEKLAFVADDGMMRAMKSKVTLNDVAEAAGVSTATVDRVLNSRLPVREGTALRVISAAEKLGYHAVGVMRARLKERVPVRHLGFCLQKRNEHFYQTLAAALQQAAAQNQPETCVAHITFMDALEPAAIAEQLLELGSKVDALAIVAVDHPHVTAAVETLYEQGKPCFALLSDISAPHRAGYIGLDNRQRGRTAAWAVSRLNRQATGEVGVFVGSHRYLGHELSEISFRSYLRENAPGLKVLDTLVNLEDPQLAYEATLELLARHPELVGLHLTGGGGAGVIRALREEAADRQLVVVCNELNATTRAALIDGVVDLVIHTPQERLAQTAVAQMLAATLPGAAYTGPQQKLLAMDLFTPENMG
ncbi:transcriptional regulator, LacI family [Rhodoferax sp. OV413]|nr:transcriptional regulator, LacI family [Rhodoferax sp. OV413]